MTSSSSSSSLHCLKVFTTCLDRDKSEEITKAMHYSGQPNRGGAPKPTGTDSASQTEAPTGTDASQTKPTDKGDDDCVSSSDEHDFLY